jgi:tRNA threonylcarbamoyladenosine biosynthesis protein TsaB
MILAFETSTDVCSVVYQNDDGEMFEKRIQGRSVHSDHLFLFTHQLMDEHKFSINQIKTVLVSNGPGSYTGLRIAASAVKGMFFKTDAVVFAVNTLAGFAASISDESSGTVHAIIDARRTHVYHQQFELNDRLMATSELRVIDLSELEKTLEPRHILVGTGIQRIHPEKLVGVEVYGTENISAGHLIELFELLSDSEFFEKTSLEDLNPEYITSNQINNSKPT